MLEKLKTRARTLKSVDRNAGRIGAALTLLIWILAIIRVASIILHYREQT